MKVSESPTDANVVIRKAAAIATKSVITYQIDQAVQKIGNDLSLNPISTGYLPTRNCSSYTVGKLRALRGEVLLLNVNACVRACARSTCARRVQQARQISFAI